MCIIIRGKYRRPYNNSNIRWKVLRVRVNTRNKERLDSPFRHHNYWSLDKWKHAQNFDQDAHDIGIHVLLTKEDAVKMIPALRDGNDYVIAKVVVENFNASGYWQDNQDQRNETWKKAKVLQVFTASGRNNITKRFI